MLFRSPTSEPGRFFAKDPCVIRYQGRGFLYFSKQLIEETGYDRFVIGIAVSEDLDTWEEIGTLEPVQEAEGRGEYMTAIHLEGHTVVRSAKG